MRVCRSFPLLAGGGRLGGIDPQAFDCGLVAERQEDRTQNNVFCLQVFIESLVNWLALGEITSTPGARMLFINVC